jgi:EPS-associated MarR family transcriptional regulator
MPPLPDLRSILHKIARCGSYCPTGLSSASGPQMTRRYTAANEDLRFRVLRLLRENPKMSHREIARSVGVSAGGVNYCMNALIEKGLVKVRNFREADNKLRYAYVLTPQGLTEKTRLTGRFLQRKLEEYEALKAEIASVIKEAETSDVTRPDDKGE